MKTHWNYRVVITREKSLLNPDDWSYHFTIRDVYYENDVPKSWGADPQYPSGEDRHELMKDLQLMMEAVQKRPLTAFDDELKELKEGETYDTNMSFSALTYAGNGATINVINNGMLRPGAVVQMPPFDASQIKVVARAKEDIKKAGLIQQMMKDYFYSEKKKFNDI